MSKELQTINTQVRPVLPHDMDSAWRMSVAISKSGLAPKGIQTTEAIFTAIQMGAEVGLSPMQALQNIAVVNGRPTIWGDAQLGLVRGCGLLESFEERIDGAGDSRVAFCIVKRKGDPVAITGKFSVSDAKTAGLWNKSGPWVQYPERMLKMRARGFALRDGFSDILKGIYSQEEMVGSTAFQDVTPTTQQHTVNDLNAEFLNIETNTPKDHLNASIDAALAEREVDGDNSSPTEEITLENRVHTMLAELSMDAGIAETEDYKDLWQEVKKSGDKALLQSMSEAMA